MDPNLIYVKTAAGEDAIQQRTRVIQRNVRMILILVDGQSAVADLSRKTGNPQLTENALSELEKGGFIEPRLEQHDSLWEESKRVAQEIRSAAIEKAIESSSSQKRENYPDFNQAAPRPRSLPDFGGQVSDIPISLHSMFDTKEEAEFSTSQFSIAPDELEALRYPSPVKERLESPRKTARARTSVAAVPKPSFFAHLRSLWASADRDMNDEPVKLKPLRRTSKSGLGWLPRSVLALLVIAILGTLAVLFFPSGIYLRDVEAAFSTAVGRPVRVQTVSVGVSPVPGLILGDVRVGADNDEIRIREVFLQPELTSVFSPRKEFRRVILRGAAFELERVGGMPVILASLAEPNNVVGVGAIRFENASVSFSGIAMDDVDAEINLDPVGKMKSLSLRSADKRVHVVAAPAAGGVDLTVEAFGWGPSEGSKLVFDSMNFDGRLNKGVLAVSNLEMRVFDGLIRGEAVVRSAGAAPTLAGDVSFERINASRLGAAFGIGGRFVGDAAGKIRFSTSSPTWSNLLSGLSAEGDFGVQRGHFSGIDLAEAIRRVSGAPVLGGVTNFEQLSGRMKLTPERKQFLGLTVNSGLMQSTGYLDIGKDLRLAGRFEVQMRGSVNQRRVPVSIGGTLESPTAQVVGR